MRLYHEDIFRKAGIDISSFRPHGNRGGYQEYHGPCWHCGGKDRMTIKLGKFKYTEIGLFVCRVCDARGTLDGLMKEPIDPKTLAELQAISQKNREIQEKEIKRHQDKMIRWMNEKLVNALHAKLIQSHEYHSGLEKDGITLALIKKWKIGLNPKFQYGMGDELRTRPAIAFPIKSIQNGHYINIRMRILGDPECKYRPFARKMGTQFLLARYQDDEFIYIVEGEKKAIVLHDHGFSAAGLFGTNSFKNEWIPWFKENFRYKFIMFDGKENNPGVARAAQQIAQKVNGIVIWPPGKPDDLILSMSVPEFLRSIRRRYK